MSFAKILAPLTGGPRDAAVLASAFAAARPFNAHVVALFVRPDPSLAMPFYGEGVSTVMVQEVIAATKEASDTAAQGAKAALAVAAQAAGVAVTGGLEKRGAPTASFQETLGNFADCVVQAARLSDFVVFGPLKEGEHAGITEAFEATLIEAGRPVLLSARAAAANFCDRVAIAWNGSNACAHAAMAALPYLKCAKSVEILTVKRANADPVPTDELTDYLRLQGVAASTRSVDAGERAIGEVLLETAARDGAGLVVLGGYGHSRLRELFVSGVTRQVVGRAELPLFLVH